MKKSYFNPILLTIDIGDNDDNNYLSTDHHGSTTPSYEEQKGPVTPELNIEIPTEPVTSEAPQTTTTEAAPAPETTAPAE